MVMLRTEGSFLFFSHEKSWRLENITWEGEKEKDEEESSESY